MNPAKETNPAPSGNASNPAPGTEQQPEENSLLDKKAAKYIREAGNIEDMPDAEDEEAERESPKPKQ